MNPIIEKIISEKQIAVVGVSDRDFGGVIYKTLKTRGYDVIPVHPTRGTFEGDNCLPSLRAIRSTVIAAIIAVSPERAEMVVEDAAAARFTHLWFQQGKNFSRAIEKARASGLQTVSSKCILMYAQPVTGIHAVHRFLARSFGRL